ncbi:MAG: hypothetical protein O7D32_05900 [bacterium]|nr:hypothetical protein [bacterium]
MRSRIALLTMVVLLVGVASMAGETAWFDMTSCDMCKSMSSTEGLMDHMTWNQYDLSNGVISVTTVEPAYLDKYRAAHAEMGKAMESMEKGEKTSLCGSCTYLGMCMQKGASHDYVETETGDIFIVTASNPELVAELQTWAKRNREEMAKM